ALNEAILAKDYVGELGEPVRRKDGQFLLDPKDLFKARTGAIEAAISLIPTLKPDQQSEQWDCVYEHLQQLKQFRQTKVGKATKYTEPFNSANLLRLTQRLRETPIRLNQVTTLLRKTIRSTKSEQMLLSLRLQLADNLARQKDKESLNKYKLLLKSGLRINNPQVKPSEVHLKIGQWYYHQNDIVAAERSFQTALRWARKERNSASSREAMRYLSDEKAESGQYDQAVSILKEVAHRTPESDHSQSLIDAIQLSEIQGNYLYEPLTALDGISSYLKSAKLAGEQAALRELHGNLLGKVMQFEDAITELETAKELWTKVSYSRGADWARMLRTELQMFGMGNFKEAQTLLDTWEEIGTKTDVELTCRLRLLRVLWFYQNNDKSAARKEWLKIRNDKTLLSSLPAKARILAAGVALNLGNSSTVRELIKTLRRMSPASARLPALEVFQFTAEEL
ncbi:MAG: tetratricopeptide repeat protein, partial [Pyrinomonadaceae bacterium]